MTGNANAGFSEVVSTLRTRSGAHRVLVALVAASIAGASLVASPAGGQTTTTTADVDDSSNSQVSLVSQTNWVSGSSPFDLSLGVQTAEPIQNLDIVVTVFSALRNRSAFTQSLDDTIGGSAVILDRKPLADVLGPDGQVRLSYPVGDATQRSTYIRNPGVYPVRVELRETGVGEAVDSFVTHLVKTPSTGEINPLSVATALPISTEAGGVDDVLATPSEGAEFNTVSAAIRANAAVPVAVVPSGESLSRLSQDEDGELVESPVVQTLESSISQNELLRGMWSPVPASLYDGPASEIDEQFGLGNDVVGTVGTPSQGVWPGTEPLTPSSLRYLQTKGIEQLIVRESNLSESSQSTTLAKPFQVRIGEDTTMTALQADDQLSNYFVADDPVLAAHNLLADMAVIYNDYPAQDRVLTVMPPTGWSPNAAFLQTYLSGLGSAPTLEPMPFSAAFTIDPQLASGRSGLTRSLVNLDDSQNPSLDTERLEESRRRLTGFASMVEDGNATWRQLDQRLLLTQAIDLDADDRDDRLEAFDDAFADQIAAVRLPDERSIRLTARTGEIPVSIQNDTGYTVTVKIRVTGDQLAFPDGQERTVEVSRQQLTERFAIEARTSGTYPIQVRMTSPDGGLVLYDSRVTVRSTATSAVGVILTAGSLAFLVLWWVASIYKSRRKPKLTEPAHE